MRGLKTWAWAAVLTVVASSPAFAQLTTGGTTGTTGTTGGTGGLSSGGAAPTGSTGGAGGGSGGSGTSGGNLSMQNATLEAPPTISMLTETTSSLQKSNRFAGYYANPYYQGITVQTNTAPGGFGMPLYPATTGTGTFTGGRGGATGAGGLGARGQTTNTQSGILIPLRVQMTYAAEVRFPAPAVPATKLQSDIRGVIDTGGLANPQSVQVIANGTNIVLRGTVKDDEEARLAEGLVRLTPGVGNITNELTFPVASK